MPNIAGQMFEMCTWLILKFKLSVGRVHAIILESQLPKGQSH